MLCCVVLGVSGTLGPALESSHQSITQPNSKVPTHIPIPKVQGKCNKPDTQSSSKKKKPDTQIKSKTVTHKLTHPNTKTNTETLSLSL